jgi:exodeoxyribonuclease V beta subunit
MKIFDVLSKSQNIFGKNFIKASAGCGKTFTIEHLVIRLLLEKKDITIENILVVTFTKKATAELKYRIKNNIIEVLKILENPQNNNLNYDYLIPFLSEERRKEGISKLKDSLLYFDLAKIFTIHSFCYKSLKEFSFLGNINIEIEEKNDIEFIKSKIFDFIKFKLNPKKYDPNQIEIIFKKINNFDDFFKKFNSARVSQETVNLKNFEELFLEFKDKLKFFNKKIDEEEFLLEFNELSKRFKKIPKHNSDNYFFTFQKILTLINGANFNYHDFSHILSLKGEVFEFLAHENIKIAFLKKSFDEFAYFDSIKNMQNHFCPIIKEAISFDKIFSRLCKDLSVYLDQVLDEEEILTFDRMQIKMNHALQIDKFLNALQTKYKAAIVDEFQDTDFIQFEIFDKLFFNKHNIEAFYLIGDPKQSIYSFRNADLYIYLKALEKFENVYTLNTNYRSSKELISSLNYLFSKFSSKIFKLPKLNQTINYEPINAVKENIYNFNDDKKTNHFFISQDLKQKTWPTKKNENDFFYFIANEISYLLNQNIDLNNICVLVKDRYQANRLSLFFKNLNIKNNVFNPSTLKDSRALKDLELFLEAVMDPNDPNKIKIALSTAFIGYDIERIKNFNFPENILNNFYSLKKIFLEMGVSFFFSKFFQTKFDKYTILEKISLNKDLNFLFDLEQIIDLFLQQNKITLDTVDSFFDKIKSLDEDNEIVKRKSYFDQGLSIMTIHMSKGLEFDIVFSLSLAFTNNINSESIDEIEAEKLRELYVALTRAKYRNYIPIAYDLSENKNLSNSAIELFFQNSNFLMKNDILSALENLKKEDIISYSYIENNNFKVIEDEKINIFEPKFFKYENKIDSIFSFSSLKKDKNINFIEKDFKDIKVPIGAQVGTFYHLIFDKIFSQKIIDENKIFDLIKINSPIYGFENFENEIFLDVINTLNINLFSENGFCLKDLTFENIHSEIEFLYPSKNNFIKGFIDLFFYHEDKYYLVDWKSNYLGDKKSDYEKELLEKEMEKNNYFMQAAIYTNALFNYLKNIKKIDPHKNFGGMFYIFIRGSKFNEGVYHFYPDIKKINNLTSKNIGIFC